MIRQILCAVLLAGVFSTTLVAENQIFPMGSFDPNDMAYLGATPGYATYGNGFFSDTGGFESFDSPIKGSETMSQFMVTDLMGNVPVPSEFSFSNSWTNDGGFSGTTVNEFTIEHQASGEMNGVDGVMQGALAISASNTPFHVVSPTMDPVPLNLNIHLDANGFLTGGGFGSQAFDVYVVEIPEMGAPSVMNQVMGVYTLDENGLGFNDFQVDMQVMPDSFDFTPQVSVNEQAMIMLTYDMDIMVQPGDTYSLLIKTDLGVDTTNLGFSHLNSSNTLGVTISSSDPNVQFGVLSAIPEPATALLLATCGLLLGLQRSSRGA